MTCPVFGDVLPGQFEMVRSTILPSVISLIIENSTFIERRDPV